MSAAGRIELETDDSKPLLEYTPFSVDGQPRPCYACSGCGAPLALKDELVSKAFSGSGGPAFLFRSVCALRQVTLWRALTPGRSFNVKAQAQQDRLLLTGCGSIAFFAHAL
jgi:hypothetical protein